MIELLLQAAVEAVAKPMYLYMQEVMEVAVFLMVITLLAEAQVKAMEEVVEMENSLEDMEIIVVILAAPEAVDIIQEDQVLVTVVIQILAAQMVL